MDPHDITAILQHIRALAAVDMLRVSQHAHQEMLEEDIVLEEVLQAIAEGQIIENYPDHRRGACCLLYGRTGQERPLHIVCTTDRAMLFIITVYVPQPPKWVTPTERSPREV